ncbi:DUF1353 domain-containing protein [Variovorax sp. J22R115]|uniref:DUF1353 domain-containing protein n=1 Tax=Variovorax sp. J22R115 TaxID=3053509 RepID=UPI00257500C0|nr:DUF1353 domain-containing protein [Variovorax sp. J22R115]MDM0053522.1 DUF1353 domain-containing protein [Variovorax sp. J22R115]
MLTREAWRTACEGQLGKPYIWGADGPDAFDCSGFAQWAMSLLNLDPPGDQPAEGLYRFFRKGRSQSVPADTATLGDIVFFGSEESVTHVALAWGGGQMLEAGGGGRGTTTPAIADKQGARVRIANISRRKDLVEILRPNALPWVAGADGLEAALEAAAGWGSYVGGAPVTEWLPDGRHMQLKRPFGYVQESGREWPVPEGAVVDGASIPRVFWSLIGGPFEGPYRDASIVHDHYCDVQTQPWPDTHRIFYEGMLCSGVSEMKAKVMYYAVYRFGPRWTIGPAVAAPGFESAAVPSSVSAPLPVEAFDAASFEEDAELIQSSGLDADAIEQLAEARSSIGNVSAEASAAAVRQPLLQRLVQLQEAAADESAAQAAGALLRRYSASLCEVQPDGALEAAPPYELLKPEYEKLFATCMVRPERKGEVAWHVQKLLQYRPRYEKVGAATEVPWWFIGVVHALEASFNFHGHLHNGDPLSGRTVQVPKGRPPVWNPPNDWETSAIDAITYEKLANIGDWSVSRALYRWERYNGYGYHARNINSPYLWSFSNHYTKGKYVKDGVFDANAVSKQCGAAVMLRALQAAGAVSLGQ